jgi:septum formation protein
MTRNNRPLILASTSPYRRQLLTRLRLPFETHSPGVDEAAISGESPQDLACRLARAKAGAVAAAHPAAWVIGSDQTASLGDKVLGKPGSNTRARAQLRACSGRVVTFFTAVALQCLHADFHQQRLATVTVTFRTLSSDEIARYLASEPALDCAGSFKIEGLGISLFEQVNSQDPSALEGLPLIAVCDLLRSAGFALP